jgi:molybdopterin converting factor small subunit|tara:strand:+ start:168 stop:455 length:288 start_codon:yes stop_codon:yes gene_type:complete
MTADAEKSVTVFLPAHMREQAKNTAEVLTAPGSLMDVIMEVANQFPDLKEDLLRGIQEREIAIAIDEMITENDPTTRVEPGAEIRLLPAIAGGDE